MFMILLGFLLSALILIGHLYYRSKNKPYSDNEECEILLFIDCICVGILLIIMPISAYNGQANVASLEVQKNQIEYVIENAEDYNSRFMQSLYGDVLEYNSFVARRQHQLNQFIHFLYITKDYEKLDLIDISKFPSNATIRARVLMEN